MQHDEPRRPGAARPSLLSSAPQAEANSKSILNDLDGGKKKAPPSAARSRKGLLWGGALLGLALLAGAAVWMVDVQQEELHLALASSAEQAPAPQQTELPATQAAVQPPSAPDAPAAAHDAVLGNSADIAAALAAPSKANTAATIEEASPAQREQSLREMLNAPVAKVAKVSAEPAVKAKATPARATAHAEPKPRPSAPKLAKATDKQKDKAKEKPARQIQPAPDSDVALLAALVAHTHATRPLKQPEPLSVRLKQCGQLGAKGAEQCRTRACSSAKNDPQCKPAVTLAKETGAP